MSDDKGTALEGTLRLLNEAIATIDRLERERAKVQALVEAVQLDYGRKGYDSKKQDRCGEGGCSMCAVWDALDAVKEAMG